MRKITIRVDDETYSFLNRLKSCYNFDDISKGVRFSIDLLKVFIKAMVESKDLAKMWGDLSDKKLNSTSDTPIVKNEGG